jgi:hypothetical protein
MEITSAIPTEPSDPRPVMGASKGTEELISEWSRIGSDGQEVLIDECSAIPPLDADASKPAADPTTKRHVRFGTVVTRVFHGALAVTSMSSATQPLPGPSKPVPTAYPSAKRRRDSSSSDDSRELSVVRSILA